MYALHAKPSLVLQPRSPCTVQICSANSPSLALGLRLLSIVYIFLPTVTIQPGLILQPLYYSYFSQRGYVSQVWNLGLGPSYIIVIHIKIDMKIYQWFKTLAKTLCVVIRSLFFFSGTIYDGASGKCGDKYEGTKV